jgi:hypothetical protein
MRAVDELLEDEELVDAVYDAQGKRHPQSRIRGRQQTPAEVAVRMLILKHVRNWSYETLEREVRANVVYRSFCRIGMEKVPDAKTLVRLGQAIRSGIAGDEFPSVAGFLPNVHHEGLPTEILSGKVGLLFTKEIYYCMGVKRTYGHATDPKRADLIGGCVGL